MELPLIALAVVVALQFLVAHSPVVMAVAVMAFTPAPVEMEP
jgi:hypothetical protein